MIARLALTTVATGLGLLGLLAPGPGLADRLHLSNGGVIEVDAWTVEGGSLIYETEAGTVGIPHALVRRIERSDGQGSTTPLAAAGPSAARPAAPASGGGASHQRLTQAKAAFDRRDYHEAASLYRRVMDDADARFPAARVYYALCQLLLGEDALSLGAVLDGLARDPDQAQLLELLGDLRDREERVEDALTAWQRAFDLAANDRLRQKILRAQRELHVGRDYELELSSHFNLRYDGEVDPELSEAVLAYLEEQYWVIAGSLNHSPRQPITVLLYPKQEFRDVTESPEWVGGLYDGKIRVPLGGLDRLNPVARNVLLHELTHAFVHSKTRANCPRWLHEGLAQIMERRSLSAADRLHVSRRLAQGDPAAWESGGFSYPMALSLVRYLEARNGFAGLVRLLDGLSEGQEIEQALLTVYGEGYDRLCNRWASQAVEG